jgi:hypothetical protein
MVLTTAPPMIKTAARAPQSILLHFFATGFVVPEVDVAVSMASAAVIFFCSSGFGACTWSVPSPRVLIRCRALLITLSRKFSAWTFEKAK